MNTKNSLEIQARANPVLERVKQVRAAQGEPVCAEAASLDFKDKSWNDTIHWVKH